MSLLFLVTIFCVLVTIQGECNSQSYITGHGLILHPIRDDYVISANQKKYTISNNARVTLFCPSKFEPANYYDPHRRPSTAYGQLIILDCKDNFLYYSTSVFRKERLDSNSQLKCPEFVVSYYATKLEYCAYEGLILGIPVEDTPIALAEFCYNYNSSEIVFVHYVAAKRTTLLKGQAEYNPSKMNVSAFDSNLKVSVVPEVYLTISLGSEHALFMPLLKHLIKNISYSFDELVPNTAYSSHFRPYLSDTKSTTIIPWWTGLKIGNWQIFQNILEKESSKRPFEIYAGKSHIAKYPANFTCNSEDDITFQWKYEDRPVPLYIWNYIIPRSSDYDDAEPKEFVLIGINSPFVNEAANSSLVICKDICDEIDWLHPLEVTRTIAAFGYIFCCKPEDVQGVLHGLPQINSD